MEEKGRSYLHNVQDVELRQGFYSLWLVIHQYDLLTCPHNRTLAHKMATKAHVRRAESLHFKPVDDP